MVDANARALWALHADFDINVHNTQTLASSTYKYELATAATGGTVLTEHTTGSLTGSANEQFTLAARVPVGTTALYLRGSRTSGAGTSLVHIGGRIYLLSEVSGDKVDITSAGFDGVLSNTDNTAQKAFQKLDDFVVPLAWSPTTNDLSSNTNITVADTRAVRIGNYVWYSGKVDFSRTSAGTTASALLSMPVNQTTIIEARGTTSNLQLGMISDAYTHGGNNIRVFTRNSTNFSTSLSFYFSGWYPLQ